ncbi:MAG: hypothetical protein H7839_00380 [Magnetococcus sp. YQC-5]
MAIETVLLQVGKIHAPLLPKLAGQTFTVGKVVPVGDGLANWLFMTPVKEGAGSMVALKLEGIKQAAVLPSLVGKTVTVGKAPAVLSGTSAWLSLHTGIAAKTGAATALYMAKVEGTRNALELSSLAGKQFTVAKASTAGTGMSKWLFLQPANVSAAAASKGIVAVQVEAGAGPAGAAGMQSLLGKTFTILHSPVAGNGAGKWLVFQPAAGAATKLAASSAGAVAVKGGSTLIIAEAATPKTTAAVVQNATVKSAAVTQGSAMATKGSVMATKGTIWSGTGSSLGLGLGLGAWGPILLAGALTALGVGIYGYMKRKTSGGLEEVQS